MASPLDQLDQLLAAKARPWAQEHADLVSWLVNHADALARIARAAEHVFAERNGPGCWTAIEQLGEALAGLGADSEAGA